MLTLLTYTAIILNTMYLLFVFSFCSCDTDSSFPDIQMGFCIEATGMTQGGEDEPHCDLGMEGGSFEEPSVKDEAESMEDDQDPEVRGCL